MTALNDRFWAKVLFSQFIKHYRKMDDTEIVADIKQSMDDLEDLNEEGCSFGAKMVRWSMERVEQYPMARENGKKGGRPRKNDNKGDACRREAQDESATVSDISGTPEARQGKKRTGDTQSKGDCHSEKSPVRTMPLPSWEEFLEFVDGEGLDYTDAREWWEMTMEDREGKDRDGNPIRNWKAALQGYCKTKTENRR